MKRRYMISPAPDGEFHVGRARDGRQFVLGAMFSEMVAYVFDADGRLVSRERRTWREPEENQDSMEIYWLFEPRTRRKVEEKAAAWRRELGFVEAPIVVDAFFDADFNVGIEDMPSCLEVAISDESELERRERDMERVNWIQSEMFVFWWELDYWMVRKEMMSGV